MDMGKRKKELQATDKAHVWHPFTQMKGWQDEDPIVITEGRDCFIKDISGKWYLDAVASLWVNVHGHRKKELDDALKAQIDKIAHTTMLGLANEPAIELAGILAELLKESFGDAAPSKIFYSDNGSTSVEVALKMAFQYWQLKGEKGRKTFLTLNNAYHGDTIGAVSVGGMDIFHSIFGPLLFKTHKAPNPHCYRCELGLESDSCKMACLLEMANILKEHAGEIAAVIIEPLVQGAGGILVAPKGYLKGVRELCDKYDVLLIADEVATGFGRTGEMFASEKENVVPDIICLAKGITGGYLPLAATVATEEIYSKFLGETSELKTFFHGHSYTGNPLACACALASLELFKSEDTLAHTRGNTEILEQCLREISKHPHVGDVRNSGMMAGVELVRDKSTCEPYALEEEMGRKVCMAARDEGVIFRPLGNVIVLMPPLAISEDNLRQMCVVIGRSIEKVTGKSIS